MIKILRALNYIIFLIFTFLFLISPPIILAEEFIKYSNNPIIKIDPNVSWKKKHVANPFVMYENNTFKMWFAAHNSNNWNIAYATSSDGINWEEYSDNPILTPSQDGIENHVHTPRVLKDAENHYLLYYTASPDDSSYFEIRIAESSDGIHWNKINGKKISFSQNWESWGLHSPMVIKRDSTYHMWYDSHYSGKWRVGYATSNDGINWNKYLYNPLSLIDDGNGAGSMFVLDKGNKLLGFRHGGNGGPLYIYRMESGNFTTWNNYKTIITPGVIGSFDSSFVAAPAAIKHNNKYYLYYNGFNGVNNQIGLATMDLTPVVIIPGLFGSWNNDAIIHNTDVSIFDWQISPFVKEYTGIINSLKNIGYTENQDFYIFPYDWRKSIENTTNDLDVFLTEKIWNATNETKINIIGHSLGGIIGRIYTQKHPDKVNKIISIGSPHKGTALAYKPVEAGEIDTDNTLLWLAEKIILLLNKTTIETDRKTIQNRFPSLLDLFPTYNFLKNNDGNLLDTNNLQVKNPTLPNYNNDFSDIYSLFSAFYGNKTDLTTTAGYSVNPPSKIDQILGNYKDGRPKSSFQGPGDDTVLSLSATEEADLDSQIFNLDHGEIIYKKEAIKKIFDTTGISYTDSQITEGAKTLIGPSIIFLIKSPAEIEVVSNSQTYTESEGVIFIPNAQTGDYTLNIKGKEKGRYTVIILSQNNSKKDYSFKIEGEIIQDPPTSQIDTYTISFDPVSDQSPVISSSTNPSFLIDELKLYLADLNKSLNKNEITKIISNLNQSKLYLQQNNFGRLKSNLLLIQQQLLSLRNKLSNNQDKQNIFYAITKLEDLNAKYLINYNQSVNKNKLKNDLNNYQKMISSIENYLIINQQRGKDVTKNGLILAEIKNRVDKIQQYLNMQKSTQAEFLLKTIEGLMKEVRN